MKAIALLAFAFPVLFLQAAEPQPAPKTQKLPDVKAGKYSREKLDAIRAALTAQIAVKDTAENAMRSPTPEEAAALNGAPAQSTAAVVQLKNGGLALHSDPSNLSLSVAKRNADGSLSISHEPAKARKGDNNER